MQGGAMKNSFNFCFEPSLAVNRPNLAGGGAKYYFSIRSHQKFRCKEKL